MKISVIAVFTLLVGIATTSFAQRGIITKPAVGNTVMDPNQDGYVSQTAAGFSNDGYYVDEFEIPMFGIPIVGNGDVLNDNQAGPNCGTTDLTVDNQGFSVYGVLDDNGNLIFRFRIGDSNPSVEAYTILIDTDGKIGPDDPNATPNNPGFEIDITLIKNASKGVYVYNIDGIESCPTPEFNYSFASNFQIAVADIVSCSDPDYFYDFFVPFNDIVTRFGVSGLTEMRFVAVTNISATCAMAGKISDVGGVDDGDYAGCNTCAFLDLVNNQCPTAIQDLCPTCQGFLTGVTPKPTINTPLKVGEFTATGTTVPNAEIFVDVYDVARVLKDQQTNIADAAGDWIVNLSVSLQLGDSVTAKARAPGLCSSGSLSSGASFTIVTLNQPPVLNGGSSVLVYNENDPPLRINGGLTITDPDDTEIESATVVISNNFVSGQDLLTFTPIAGVSGTFNPGTGTITFTGTATLTSYQTLLRSVHYSNSSENPNTAQRTVTMVVNDGLDDSNIFSRLINVVSVNDAPVAVNDSGTTNEDTPITLLNITANDTDVDGTINPATVDLDPATGGIQNTFVNAQGTWSVNAAGDVTYTPALNFNGLAVRSYTVQDNLGAVSSPANISITVNPVNDPPVATNDSGTTLEDTPITLLNITSNDTDVDGTVNASTVDLDPLTAGIQNTFTNAQGSWSVNASGDLTYTPTLNFNGLATINYTVNDNLGATSAPASINITVTPVNDAPVAVNDSGVTNEDTPVTLLAITANDTDVDGTVDPATVDLDLLTAGIQNSISNAFGSWSVNASGDLTYTPLLNFNGVATKQYRVNDNQGAASNTATVTITVNAVNDPPIANNDTGVTNEDTPVTLLNITANDTDVDGTVDPATVDLDPVTGGIQNTFVTAEGNWSVNGSGDVTYTPVLNFNGVATINYVVNDNLGATSLPASISITVNAVNDAPTAVNDVAVTNEDTPITFNVTGNDTDPDGTIDNATVDLDLSVGGIQNTFSNGQGAWSVDANGDVTYTPVLNFNGVAVISYTVNDNQGSTSSSATITVTVNAVNDPPVANDDSGTTFIDTPVTLFNVTANDTDVDGTVDASTVDLDTGTPGIQNVLVTAEGNWSVDASGNVTFTPVLSFSGTAAITYTVNDNGGATSGLANISILVDGVDPMTIPPVANDDIGSTDEDTPVTFNITGNDTDADGIDASTVDLNLNIAWIQSSITNAQGTWSVNASGDLTYTPFLNLNGIVTKQYTVRDNVGLTSNVATVTITVNAVNDPPVAVQDNGATNEDTPVTLNNITANDTDVDGTVDAATVDLDPSTGGIQNTFVDGLGSWSVNGSGDLTFTPALNFNGIATKTYTVNDNLGATSNLGLISITVNAVNDAPVAVDDVGITDEDTPITLLNITSNDTDVDGTINAATVDLNPALAGIQNTFANAQGNWAVNASGDVTFTPTLNFNGIAIRSYTVSDNLGAVSSQANITITVNPVNDPPVATDDSGTTLEDTPVTLIGITSNDTDVDGTVDASTVDLDPATAGIQNTLSDASGDWTVNATGDVTFTPALDFNGLAARSYTVNDDLGATSLPASINITVGAVNDPPVVTDDIGMTDEDTPVTIPDITSNDTDVDGTVDVTTVDLDLLTAGIQNSASNTFGTWSVNATGDVLFTPVLNFNGIATKQYRVNDNQGATSLAGTITITVNPVNDAPVAVDDAITTNEDTPVTLADVTGNDTDVDGTMDPATVDLDPLTAGIQNMFTNAAGEWSVNGLGEVTYTPALNFNGITSISYVANDDQGALSSSAMITITVDPVNDPPTLTDLFFSTDEEVPLSGSVYDLSDVDVEGTSLSVDTSPVVAPTNGEIVINEDGTFVYTPGPLFSGQEVVQVSICDEGIPLPSACATKLITITVIPVNHPPDLFINGEPGGLLQTSTDEDTPLVVCFEAVDPDGDDVTLSSVVNLQGGGTLTVYENIEFCFEFIPAQDFNGLVVWEVTVCDDRTPSLCGVVTIEIDVLPVNDPPTAVRDSINVLRNVISFGNVTDNDFDIEGDAFVADGTPVVMPAHGVAILSSDGNFSYQSDVTFRGIDSLVYQICDDGIPQQCGQGTLVIVVGDLPLRPYQGITPNGDGDNDYWRIDGIDFYTENKVRVFDRFNNLVFEMAGYNNENKVWKGEANRGLVTGGLPDETYFYNIDLGDGSAPVSGFVVLKRK